MLKLIPNNISVCKEDLEDIYGTGRLAETSIEDKREFSAEKWPTSGEKHCDSPQSG